MSDGAEVFDELGSFVVVVEDELAAGDAAVHVVGRSRDEQTGKSPQGDPPMRRRDLVVRLSRAQPHKCGSVYVALRPVHRDQSVWLRRKEPDVRNLGSAPIRAVKCFDTAPVRSVGSLGVDVTYGMTYVESGGRHDDDLGHRCTGQAL